MLKEHGKGFIIGIAVGVFLTISILSVGRYFGIQLYIPGSATQQVYDKSKVIEKCIDKYYQGEIKDEELANGAAKGMVSALGDKYSQYYTEEEYEELLKGINGSYVGIGVSLRQEADLSVQVAEVSEDGPAAQAGIRENDRFLKIDGTDVSAMQLNDIVSMIKKDSNDGRTILITVERQNEKGEKQTLDTQVVCSTVNVISVTSKKYGAVGYIRITEFDKETDEQFGIAVENMRKDDVSSLILDVRDNGGGSLDSVINMLDELLPEGELITEKSKKEGDKSYRSTDKSSFDKPMIVLINGRSASASEVFAGTLQARGAAVLVGTQSFGKGIVQAVFSLSDSCGGGIKLTTAEYFLPGGISIHKKGLIPDIEVNNEEEEEKDKAEEYDESRDHQLQRALQLANGGQ